MTEQYTRRWYAILATTLSLAGCQMKLDNTSTAVVQNRPGPSFYVHEVVLKDGTRCVISTSGLADGGTGVDCDWRSTGSVE